MPGGGYTLTGPFDTGGAPGIDSGFLNNVENFLASINSGAIDTNISADGVGNLAVVGSKINPVAVSQSGSTSGSMTLYQPLVGIVKLAVIIFSNFRNNGGSTQGLIPPVPFVGRSKVWAGALPSTGIIFQASGVSRSISIITALSSSGGSFTNATTLFGLSQGEILGGWDGMIVPSGGSAVNDGVVVVLGT